MKAIKTVVALLGVLLIMGLGLLGYGFYMKARGPGQASGGTPAAVEAGSAVTDFGTVRLDLPPGARIVQMEAAGGRIVLRVATPDGHERLLVLDPAQGRVSGTFLLPSPTMPQPAAPAR
jgi:hypothetical protein